MSTFCRKGRTMKGTDPAETAGGTLYGVSVGPGSPDLLTIRALNILESVPTIAYPKSVSDGGSQARDIVSGYIDSRNVPPRIVELVFPMTKDESILEKARMENARLLTESLALGDVAFISIGDILFYSTFGNLLAGLKKVLPQLRVSVVPGVTSFNGAAARIVEPLVQGSESFAVIPATYEASHLEKMIDLHETVVFMKINRVIPALLRILDGRGLLSKCIYLEHVETSREMIVRDVETLLERDVPYMSLLILRKNGWGDHGKTS